MSLKEGCVIDFKSVVFVDFDFVGVTEFKIICKGLLAK